MDDPQREPVTAPPRDRSAIFWPAFVIALLGGQVVLILIMVYVAVMDRSFAVEPDYYQKGLHWDDIAAQNRRNTELGWQITIEIGDPVGPLSERPFRCRLADRAGEPIRDAVVDVTIFPHARGSERKLQVLEPTDDDGTYEARVRFRRRGRWEFRFVIRKDAEVFTHVVERDVYPPGESRPWRR